MRKLILVVVLFLMTGSVQANNTLPEAVIGVSPARDWFYNLEDVFFDSGDSSDPNGYISYTKWYINGVLHTSGSYWRNMSECFALYGSPSNGCYELGVGETTVEIELRVQDNSGNWDIETKVITIREYKGRKYFIKDHLGSVRTTVTREDGKVLGYDDYYPFGLTMPGRSSNSTNSNDNYKFIGEELDEEAGLTLMNLNARMYDPITARFLQIDPLFDHPAQLGLSPYNYSWNNPMNLSDPTGECPDACVVEGGAAVTAAVIGLSAVLGYSVAYATSEDVRNAHNSFAAGATETVRSTLSDAWNGVKNMFASDSDAAPAVPISGDVATDATAENSDPMITLYRGVEVDHPGFELATQGIAVPRGGSASPRDHNTGDTESNYTSWSTQQSVANYYANGTGVVLTKSFKTSQTVPSPNGYGEGEVLVPGVVTGAKVSSPNGTVWDPIKGN